MPDTRTSAAPRARWAATEGAPFPLGASWVANEDAFNFALYSRFADSVTLLLYSATEFVTPVFEHWLDPAQQQVGAHLALPHAEARRA